MPGALDGIRILDLSRGVAGPLGVLLLAEQGADVIKVEPPGGDPTREEPGSHVRFRSRRSVVLELETEAGREAFLGLCARADVVIESMAPGEAARLGLPTAELGTRFPHLIWCSVPAYPSGHRLATRPGRDSLVQARSGQQWEQPGWRPGPVFVPLPLPSLAACFLVATGVLGALYEREASGRGQHVETSLYQGSLAYTTMLWQEVERAGPAYHAVMAKTYPPGVHQQSLYECAGDAWVHAATMSGLTPTASIEEVLGLDPVDPATLFTMTAEQRAAHDGKLREAFRSRERDEVVAALHAVGLGAEAVTPMEDAYRHPQLVANGMVVDVDDPELGATTQVGVPVNLSATPGAVQRPCPLVGEHTTEVLAELDEPAPAPSRPAGSPVAEGGPLHGVRVLDLGQYLAGPFGAMVLADLGADVIKIEPTIGDGMRQVPKAFVGCQRGKRGIAVDLKSPDGLEVVRRLSADADVVHHNMTKGVAGRLGIDYETLRADNPSLVHCNTWAYGLEGPLAAFGGLDPLYQACCGIEYDAGPVAAGNPPLYLRFGMCDTANAFLSAVGVLLALFHRRRTGEGQDVWTSLLNGAAFLASDVFLAEGGAPRRPPLDAAQTGTGACHRLYETQDGWIQVAALTDEEWRALAGSVGRPELAADERFSSADARARHRGELEAILEPRLGRRTSRAWQLAFDDAGVPAEIPLDTNEGELVLHDDDNVRLGLVAEYEHRFLGRIRQFGDLIRFSATPAGPRRPPPAVGQHTREVLAAAGWTDAEVDDLRARGVVYEPDDAYRWPV